MILQVRKKQPGHNHLDKNNHQSHKNPSVGTRAFTRDDSCSETAPQRQAQPARAHIRRFSQAVLPSAEIWSQTRPGLWDAPRGDFRGGLLPGDATWDRSLVQAPAPAPESGSRLKVVIPDVHLSQAAVLPVSPLPLSLPPSFPFVYIIIPQHSQTGLYYVRGR